MKDDAYIWHTVARLDELEEDEPKAVKVGETLIGLYLIQGSVYALSNVCSHEFALLTEGFVEGDRIECPLHQAQFRIPTGEAVAPPAEEDIPTYPVKVVDGEVLVGLLKG